MNGALMVATCSSGHSTPLLCQKMAPTKPRSLLSTSVSTTLRTIPLILVRRHLHFPAILLTGPGREPMASNPQ